MPTNVQPLLNQAIGQMEIWHGFRGCPPPFAPRGCPADGRRVDPHWTDRFPTSLPHRLALRAALERRQTVAVISLVAPVQALCLRLLLTRAKVPLERVRRGALEDEDFPRLVLAAGELSLARLHFVEAEELTSQRPYGGLANALKHVSPELVVMMSAESGAHRMDPEALRQFAALRGCRALHFTC